MIFDLGEKKSRDFKMSISLDYRHCLIFELALFPQCNFYIYLTENSISSGMFCVGFSLQSAIFHSAILHCVQVANAV